MKFCVSAILASRKFPKACIAEAPKPPETPGGGIGGFFETLKERFQPDPAQQSSTEGPSKTEGAEGRASPPPALTADIEADTDKKSDTPAVQSLVEGQTALHAACTLHSHCLTRLFNSEVLLSGQRQDKLIRQPTSSIIKRMISWTMFPHITAAAWNTINDKLLRLAKYLQRAKK